MDYQLPSNHQTSRKKISDGDCGFKNIGWIDSFWGKHVIKNYLNCGCPDESEHMLMPCWQTAHVATLGAYTVVNGLVLATVEVAHGVIFMLSLPCRFDISCSKYEDEKSMDPNALHSLKQYIKLMQNLLEKIKIED